MKVLCGLFALAFGLLVGCGKDEPAPTAPPSAKTSVEEKNPQPPKAAPEKLIVDSIVEALVRKHLKKPEGELTEEDLEKVTSLDLDTYAYQFNTAGLKDIAKLQQLTYLNLSATRITDAGLKDIAKLQKLTGLVLASTRITDEGLKGVAKLQKLTFLELTGTKITDEGLKEVVKLQQLTYLNLSHTQITDAGVAELKKALPKCKIYGFGP